jgi:penicillin-binding protein 2
VTIRPGPEHDESTASLLRDDSKFASGKIAFFQYLTVGVFLFLITGFWDLQVRNPEWYQERAMQNSIKSIPVLAPRGKILDRDGRVIVDNHSTFSLYLSRDNLKLEHLKPIAEGLNLDYDSLVARVRRFQSRGAPVYQPIPIKEELTPGRTGLRRFAQGCKHVPGAWKWFTCSIGYTPAMAWRRMLSDTLVR